MPRADKGYSSATDASLLPELQAHEDSYSSDPAGSGPPVRDIPRFVIVAWGGVSALLLGLASVFDLKLSEHVANGSSPWGLWFQQYSEVPGYALGGAGALVLLVLTNSLNPRASEAGRRCEPKALAVTGLCFVALCFGLGGVIYQLFGIQKVVAGGIALVVVGTGYAAIIFGVAGEQKRHLQSRLAPWQPLALSLALLAAAGEVTLTLIKLAWGRARPNMVLHATCLQSDACVAAWPPNPHCENYPNHTGHQFQCEFSGWWYPHGYRDGLFSFPSGHTLYGWVPLPVALHWTELPLWVDRESNPVMLTVIVRAFVVVWGLLVGASRVFVGAHWLSDTVVSSVASWFFAAYLWKRHPPTTNPVTSSSMVTNSPAAQARGKQYTLRGDTGR